MRDGTESFVVVAEKPRELRSLLDALGLVEDASAYPRAPDAVTLTRLGISEAERNAVPPSAWEGLALERVALVELTSAHGGAPTPKH